MIPGSVSVGLIHPGEVRSLFFRCFVELMMHDLAGNHRLFSHDRFWLHGEYGSGGIVQGRNDVAKAMVETSEAEWLMWLDTDMGFDPDIIDRLVESADPNERPVVGALCFGQKNDGAKDHGARWFKTVPTIYNFVTIEGEAGVVPVFDYERDSMVQCEATGSAAVLIHRSVLEQMQKVYGNEWYTPVKHACGTTFSEDLSFCARLMNLYDCGCGSDPDCDRCGGSGRLNCPLFVDTRIRTTHDKHGIFLDQSTYVRERAFIELMNARRDDES